MFHLSLRITRSGPWHKDLRQVAIGGLFCYQRRMNTVIDLKPNSRNQRYRITDKGRQVLGVIK